ncbi:MAG: UDP-N-acetylmuramate--L-alanine ligase [Alphaproteobacteria bacterium]|jgi:UDP-N-acetylmuramate--alanine ligase|nr:UDP-N-acetylmuramate--L-alanine ligase [Alphaproteobacteria bacterium]
MASLSTSIRHMPLDTGVFHFVGIGGIGMSGIAEVLKNLGYQVQGSDIGDSANVKRLRKLGIEVKIGHRAENVEDAAVLVVSSAIKQDNPELVAARALSLPVVRRADMLGELMRLKWAIAVGGTHGKTTTTSLIACLLDAGRKDPTVINGGIINAYGTNARLGEGDWLVAEADESDGTFTRLPATVSVVTNIDPEHLDHYGSVEALHEAFRAFMGNIPFYGFAVACTDDETVQGLLPTVEDRRVLTYGFNPQADLRAVNVRSNGTGMVFDVHVSERVSLSGASYVIADITLPMFGDHNVSNAVSAIAVALELGVEPAEIQKGFEGFGGVKRRFTITGQWNDITVVDDYGHHPVEITAVLRAARQRVKDTGGKIHAIHQPHRFSRLNDLFEDFCTCFNEADTVHIADVFAAGEAPIENVNAESLVAGIQARGHRSARYMSNEAEFPTWVRDNAAPGDLVVFLGAGNITLWANDLPDALERG